MNFEPEGVYHLYNRGNQRQPIFFKEADYLLFLWKIREQLLPYADILTWCLMPDHFHLMICVNEKGCQGRLSGTNNIQELSYRIGIMLSSYTSVLNNERGVSGSLFQKRTKIKLILVSFTTPTAFSQNIIEWDKNYVLRETDFSGPSNVGGEIFMVYPACNINFSYQMSNLEFMLSKNFNSKVSTTFNRQASYIVAPDSLTANRLLKFAQAEFDLTELYARKFRKSMFENKKAFSDPGFYQQLYDSIQNQHSVHVSELSKNTNIGMAEERLREQHEQILTSIQELEDYCKECKPKKKKKEN